MKNIVRLTETELIRLTNKIVNEQVLNTKWDNIKKMLTISPYNYKEFDFAYESEKKFKSKKYISDFQPTTNVEILRNLANGKYIIYPAIESADPNEPEYLKQSFPFNWILNNNENIDKNNIGIYTNNGRLIKKISLTDPKIFDFAK